MCDSDDSDDSDDLLGALVDGLSGALCVIVLVSIFFLLTTEKDIGASNNSIAASSSYILDFNKKIGYVRYIDSNFSRGDIDSLRASVGDGKLYASVSPSRSVSGVIVYKRLKNELNMNEVEFSVDDECSSNIVLCLRW